MGMESMFELGVVIKAVDYFTGPLRSMVSSISAADSKFKSITNTMKMMGKSKADIEGVNSALQRMGDQKAFGNIASDLQKVGMARQDIAEMEQSYMRMAQYQRDMSAAQGKYAAGKELAMSGVGDLGAAAVGGFGIMEMVKQAGEFQANMAVIQDSTGATAKQMQDFGNAVMTASANVSKFNDFQMAQIAQTLTSGGFSNVKQAQGLLLPVAKFAESQIYEHKASDPIESTKQAIEMAHVFGNYDPKSFENFLNTFNKYSLMQPGDSTQLEQTLKYLAPTALTMKMKPQDIMSLAAVDNVLGLSGSHGGTNSADMILRLIPGLIGGGPTPIKNSKGKITGYKTPLAWKGMEDLGFLDIQGNSKFFNKDGSIKDLSGLLTTMINDAKGKNPTKLMSDYKDIFGIQGGRAASLLAQPRSLEQLQKMQAQLGKTKSMEQINSDLQKTPEGQLNLLKSNSMTLMLRVGQQIAISLNPAIANANKLLSTMLKFSQAHPGFAKLIGDFTLFLVGSKAVQGVVKIIAGNFKMLGGAIDMLKITTKAGELTKLGKTIYGLRSAFTMASTGVKMYAQDFGKFASTVGKFTGKAAIKGITGIGTAFKVLGKGAVEIGKLFLDFGLALGKLAIRAATFAVEVAADWLIAMGPVGWIIAGVTALIAAGIIMWKTNFLGFRDGLKAVWKTVSTDAGQAWNWIKQKASDFMNFLKGLPGQALSIGKNIIDGLKNGLMGAVGGLMGTVKSIGSSISSTFKSILGIHSPSKVFAEHGKWIVAGLSQGIDQNAHMANQSTDRLANGVNNSFRPNLQSGGKQPIATGNTGGTINIQSGAIVIQGGNNSKEEIAQEVLRQLGKLTRGNMMNSGISVNMGAF